jgi:antigen flippase
VLDIKLLLSNISLSRVRCRLSKVQNYTHEMSKDTHKHTASVNSAILTGGSQAISALFAFLRSKFAAIWIGPEGVGILGLLSQFQNVLTTGFDLGVSNSAVREISFHRSRNENVEVVQVVRSLFRLTLYAACACLMAVAVLADPVSRWMFNQDGYQGDVVAAALSATLLLFAGAHGTLMRGHAMVRQLAIQRVLLAASSTLAAWVGYRYFGTAAVAWVMVVSAAVSWLLSVYQSRKIRPALDSSIRPKVLPLIVHGLPFLWSAFSFALVSYFIGALVVDECGLRASGCYQAAWGLTAYLIGFILTAMGQDYLPRLAAVINSPEDAIGMINAQIETGVLMAVPGMFLFSMYAERVISVMFSAEFLPAANLSQWILVGCFGRIMSWPLLFALNAQRKSMHHMFAVTAAAVMYLGFARLGLIYAGITGAAMGFVAMQVLHFFWLKITLSHTLNYKFSTEALFTALIGIVALCIAPVIPLAGGLIVFATLLSASLWRLSVLTGKGQGLRLRITAIILPKL